MPENPNGNGTKSRSRSRKTDEKRAIEATVVEPGNPEEEQVEEEVHAEVVVEEGEDKQADGVASVDGTGEQEAATIPQVEGATQERPSLRQTILEQLMYEPTFRRRVIKRLIKKLR